MVIRDVVLKLLEIQLKYQSEQKPLNTCIVGKKYNMKSNIRRFPDGEVVSRDESIHYELLTTSESMMEVVNSTYNLIEITDTFIPILEIEME